MLLISKVVERSCEFCVCKREREREVEYGEEISFWRTKMVYK